MDKHQTSRICCSDVPSFSHRAWSRSRWSTSSLPLPRCGRVNHAAKAFWTCKHASRVFVFSFIIPIVVAVAVEADAETDAPRESSVVVSLGYFGGLGDPTTVHVEGLSTIHASEDVTIEADLEGPNIWKSLYPFVGVMWRFGDRYQEEDLDYSYVDATGLIADVGVGYGIRIWQSTLRLRSAVGYSWETLAVDYVPLGLERFEVDNDGTAWLFGASLAFPFAGRVNALVAYEIVLRSDETIDGSYANGRQYEIETSGVSEMLSIGIAVAVSD